jgi:hypothetical protein
LRLFDFQTSIKSLCLKSLTIRAIFSGREGVGVISLKRVTEGVRTFFGDASFLWIVAEQFGLSYYRIFRKLSCDNISSSSSMAA